MRRFRTPRSRRRPNPGIGPGLLAAPAIAALLAGSSAGAAPIPRPLPDTLLADALAAPDPSYPFDSVTPFDTALFHWIDSLAGTSGGKTVPIYQRQYTSRFGRLGADDRAAIVSFREIRERHAMGGASAPAPAGQTPARRGYSAMLGVFLESPSLDAALRQLKPEMSEADRQGLVSIFARFERRYRVLWEESKYLPDFLEDLDRPRARTQITGYLAEMSRFFDVSATQLPRPRLVLVPVPGGGGTHAQAVGSSLLLEIRPGDTPVSQISVIAHENAHFLFNRIPDERRARLAAAARASGPGGNAFWDLLHEALPTALGQGEATARYFPAEFSPSIAWYHLSNVDRLAKKIFPVVRGALAAGRTLDEPLIREMFESGRSVVELARPPAREGR